ncbi:Hypothetical protein; putative exported protein [Herminiimonas arsenicoxydans]|uniref:Uncharacterized protein n=1 Tax=Herminiimonas arsenicoxydans TaxID=204773 RepID=A4GA10_HERAR|nr:Hypothetical protein; putative exported protein [Herminiimonas arsenicoxydans]
MRITTLVRSVYSFSFICILGICSQVISKGLLSGVLMRLR